MRFPVPVAVLTFEDTITTPLLPGFSMKIPKVRQSLAIGKKRIG
ncbi:hypothetical protein [Verrucomicrobium sp. 3C]|nr:hypothetical protein [Verrucomicrobium sp. 3C]